MKISTSLVRFNTGEISPLMAGRIDTEEYRGACRIMKNFIPSVQGPVSRRGGTRFIASAKFSGKKTRLYAFQFSAVQPYLLEFGEGYIRFFFHRQPIVTEAGTPLEVVTPYAEADLEGLSFTQSGDVMFIVHPNYPIKKLVRHSNVDWRLSDVELIDGPYYPVNTGDISIQPSGVNGTVTLTASGPLFSAADVGRHVRIMHSQVPNVKWGAAKIIGFTNAQSVTAQVFSAFPFMNTGASKAWRLGVFSQATGYPAVATFFEQRLVLAKGNGVYGSKTGNYETFSPTKDDGSVTAEYGYGYELSSEQINNICWLSSGRVLAIGTVGADFTLMTSGGDGVLPMTVKVIRHSTYGSEAVPPIKISNTTLFVQRYGHKLRAFTYDNNSDGYIARDLTTLASHITQSGIKEMALQQEPVPVVWCVLQNGGLVGLTYEAEQAVEAWHSHDLSGGFVESAVTLPSENGSHDELYLLVRRVINGTERKYIEVMEKGIGVEEENTKENFFVDCGLSYHGEKAATLFGLDHLEGETVAVLADGAVQPERSVHNGSITLDTPASVVHVGLPYVSILQPMPVVGLAQDGVSETAKKRISGMLVRVFKTLGFKIGREGHVERQSFRRTNDRMDASPALFSGDRKITFSGDWNDFSSIRIEQDQPLPLTVLGIFPIVNVNKI